MYIESAKPELHSTASFEGSRPGTYERRRGGHGTAMLVILQSSGSPSQETLQGQCGPATSLKGYGEDGSRPGLETA